MASGGPCAFLNDCAPGLVCMQAAIFRACTSDFCCASYCNLGTGEGCAGPELCEPFDFTVPVPAGLEGVGVCTGT